ncbi:redoxin domain-containing protein [Streptomyces mirabilis]|uniref:redoxin domain-containing protein n=1 Tax=Streptomyces mirabilis TaxID=68239 RepID=UPI00331EA8A1
MRVGELARRTGVTVRALRYYEAARLVVPLPRPPDDGGAAHLPGGRLPDLVLPATDGRTVGLGALGPGRTVLYVYPLSGRPGTDLPDGWDTIPGARGCTAEACAFRNHHDDLRTVGAARVYGLSSQPREYQRELAERLRLPFAILSDTGLALREALDLPTFTAGGRTLDRRLTMIVQPGRDRARLPPRLPTRPARCRSPRLAPAPGPTTGGNRT